MGPFSEDELESLPSDGSWCLLLNDLEKHVSEFMDVLNLFDRFPRWRVADVQASISSEGGSVGAHSDQFDVFLIQGTGHKRWSISDCAEYVPDNDEAFFPDAEVRVLKNFQPQSCSLLKQGDILYLPPKVAHHGVAEGCKTICTTFSVGFLAPAHDELVLSYAQASVDTHDGSQRWRDPWLKPQEHVGEISSEAVAQAAEIIRQSMPKNDAEIARWFGCHATQSFGIDPSETIPAKDLSADELVVQFAEEGSLQRRADAKFAFVQEVKDGSLEGGLFFAAGNMWPLQSAPGMELARHIANYDEIIADDWIESGDAAEYDMDSEAKTLLHDLFSSGLIYFS
jgi:ribosomal protein L16 Arg81 hydroxylase